jgi:hypothetical protein
MSLEARRLHLDITPGKSLRRDKRGINGPDCTIDDELCGKETGRGRVHHSGPREAQRREQPVGQSVDNRVPVWGGWVEPSPTVPNLGAGADDAECMLRGFKDRAHPVVTSVHVVAIGIYSAIFAEKASDLHSAFCIVPNVDTVFHTDQPGEVRGERLSRLDDKQLVPPTDNRNGETQGLEERLDPRACRQQDSIGSEKPCRSHDADCPATGALEGQRFGPSTDFDPGVDRTAHEAIDDPMLVRPAVRCAESGACEGTGRKRRPALCDLVTVEEDAVHAKAVLKPHMRLERLGALIRPGQE